MYYAKIGDNGTGFTNQIFAFITAIINAYSRGDKIIVVDNFLNDINKTLYTPISNIFNIDKIIDFLKRNYDIIIVDKNNVQFQIETVKYGINEEKCVDLTEYIKENYFHNNKLHIRKNIIFNNIKGDPCNGIVKKLIMVYKINEYYIKEIYNENLTDDIIIDFDGTYEYTLGWINTYNNNMFDNILKNITYNDDFILKSELILNKIKKENKINVIHLRLEDDGIKHWSNMNKMKYDDYKIYLEEKYINIIKKNISKHHENIILSSSLLNNVIIFMKNNGYNYHFVDKVFDDREKNAIIDLLVSKKCNNVFIGNFNMKKLNGSTFSYYIWKIIDDNITKIYIDLDNIYDNEVIVNPNCK